MKGHSVIGALLLATSLTVSGCGITYVSPLVSEQANDGVAVVPITRQSVGVANSSPYVPRSLPAAFQTVAGTSGSGAGGTALPTAPVVPDLAPGQLELRPPPPAPDEPYRIGTGDVVQLATLADGPEGINPSLGEVTTTELRQTYTVRDGGDIAIPQVGTIGIGGLTIEEAEQLVFERFVEAGLDPNFTLEIVQFNARTITVGGEVGTPTSVPVTLTVPTLDQVLTAAGGIQVDTPEYASIRIYRDGTLYQIPLESYYADGDFRSLRLAPGDSVFVDSSYDLDRALEYYEQQINLAAIRRGERTAALNQLQAEIGIRRAALEESRAVFGARAELGAEERDYVYLAGEVSEQSRYALPYGQTATLADALFDNGGFETATGNPSQIYVLRANDPTVATEPVTAWHLDARNAANLTLATQFELRPNDIIFVEEQPITRWNRAFQQFFPTLLNTAANAASN